MDQNRLEKVLKSIKDLPTLPTVAKRIIEVVNNPKSSDKELAAIVMLDPALSIKIIKLVNSAFYGFPRKVETLNQAIVILGFNTIRSLALSLTMLDYFQALGTKASVDFVSFWKHCIGVSVLSRLLALEKAPALAEEVFLSGLLHDVGILIMSQYFPNEYAVALDTVRDDKILLHEAEEEILEMDHTQVSYRLAKAWNFPESICSSIGGHHSPDASAPHFKQAAIIHAADVGVKLMKIGDVGDNENARLFHIEEEVRDFLGLESGFIDKYIDKVKIAVQAGESQLGL